MMRAARVCAYAGNVARASQTATSQAENLLQSVRIFLDPVRSAITIGQPPTRKGSPGSGAALTAEAVGLDHVARLAERVRGARMLVMQEHRKLRPHGFTD